MKKLRFRKVKWLPPSHSIQLVRTWVWIWAQPSTTKQSCPRGCHWWGILEIFLAASYLCLFFSHVVSVQSFYNQEGWTENSDDVEPHSIVQVREAMLKLTPGLWLPTLLCLTCSSLLSFFFIWRKLPLPKIHNNIATLSKPLVWKSPGFAARFLWVNDYLHLWAFAFPSRVTYLGNGSCQYHWVDPAQYAIPVSLYSSLEQILFFWIQIRRHYGLFT